MRIRIASPEEVGRLIRAARKTAGIRQDDTAGAVGVSDVSLGHLEKGAPGARLDNVLRILRELGIDLYADVTDGVAAKYHELLNRKPSRSRPQKPSPKDTT